MKNEGRGLVVDGRTVKREVGKDGKVTKIQSDPQGKPKEV